ncbi:MAG: penicillin-binding protein [Chloroflexi bacterium]|nr:penicillin-binding protein [Chloroflexota bacterium]
MPAVAHIIRRRHNRKRRARREARRSALWLTIVFVLPLSLALTPPLALVGLSVWLYAQAVSHMPTPQETVFLARDQGLTRFFDRSGQHVIHQLDDPLGTQRRWLRLADLPPYVADAALLAEDAKFEDMQAGYSLPQTALQVWRYIIGLPLETEGGLAAELTRETMLPLTRASGLDERLLEIALVAEVRRTLSPEAMLEWRLNSSDYGHDAFGLDAAAQVYFGKSAEGLSLAEATVLAMTAAQPDINPLDDARRSRERGADLLFSMRDAGLIDKREFDDASAAEIALRAPPDVSAEIAPDFARYAKRQAAAILDRLGLDGARLLAQGGLRVTTTLDMDLQRSAVCLFQGHLNRLRGESAAGLRAGGKPCAAGVQSALSGKALESPPDSGALALIDASGGEVLSLVGEAATPRYQPAVVLRPFVYMDAFLRREFTPASILYDIPRVYPGRAADLIYAPASSDGRYRGPLLLRDAMAAGLLPPVAQAASVTGMPGALRMAQALGFTSLDASRDDLELLERGGAVSVLDAAHAYTVLAASGVMRGIESAASVAGQRPLDPVAVLRIEDAAGRALWAFEGLPPGLRQTAIIEPSLAFLVNDILADADARRATLQQPDLELQLGRPAAVLDGLSQDKRDNWTVGYTPDLVLAARSGRNDEVGMSLDDYQRLGAAPVWNALMRAAHEQLGLPPRGWTAPADIEEYLVCELSGRLPLTTDHCPTRRELAPAGSELRPDNRWQTVEINRATGQLSTVHTPAELRERVAYFTPPEDVLDWWVDNGKLLPPSSYSDDQDKAAGKDALLTSPSDYAYAGASVDVVGAINRAGAQSWLLEYGADVNPDRWFHIAEGRSVDAGGAVAATWDTILLSGIHTLRLTVDFADGSRLTDSKLLTFDNTPPAVRLGAGGVAESGEIALGESVSLVAEVNDNLAIERVEFYRGDELLLVDRDWPYGLEVGADRAGEARFRALVFDQVGNRAESRLALDFVAG